MTKRFFGTKLLATALATFALASCQSESSLIEPTSDNRQDVELTITATKGDLATRTNIELNGDETKLIKTWDLKDKVHVCEADGNYVGYLEVTGLNDDKTQATFKGIVRLLANDGPQTLWFSTVGVAKDAEYKPVMGQVMPDLTYDFLNQTSTNVSALNANDLMVTDCEIIVKDKKATFTNLMLKRQFAYGRFQLKYNDEPLTFDKNTVVTVDTKAKDIKSKGTFTFPNTLSADRDNALSVTADENDFYVAFVPGSEESEIEFKVTVGEVSYVGYTSKAYTLAKNNFFRANAGGPFPINVVRETAINYTVNLENEDGTPYGDPIVNPSTEPSVTINIPNHPEKDDHEFIGWKEKDTDKPINKDSWTLTEGKSEVTLVPDYEQKKHEWKIQWKDDPAVGNDVYKTKLESGVSPHPLASVHPANPTKEGYKFLGWEYEGKMIASEKEVVMTKDNLNPIIYAKWEALAALHLYANFEGADPEKIIIYKEFTNGKATFDLTKAYDSYVDAKGVKLPSRTGYTFLGWNDDEESNGSNLPAAITIDSPTHPNQYYYAIWKKNGADAVVIAPGADGSDY